MSKSRAKSLFLKLYHKEPWKNAETQSSLASHWLQELMQMNYISTLEHSLANCLLQGASFNHEALALLIYHLSKASQEGHLCIHLDGNRLSPTVEHLWKSDLFPLLSHELATQITEKIIEGMSLIEDSNDDLPICKHNQTYYFQRYWYYESLFIDNFVRHSQQRPKIPLDLEKIRCEIAKDLAAGLLLKEQANGILAACDSSISFITGGPGTGKTFTAGRLIKSFWEGFHPIDKKNCKIVLTAPTGKAAAHLQQSIHKLLSGEENGPHIEAMTLHALLGIKSIEIHPDKPKLELEADVIVVDESSMIDIKVMSALFASIKEGARVIFLGDPHQLPPVEAGGVFSELIQFKSSPARLSITRLTKCLRTDLKMIVDFAEFIKEGRSDDVIAFLNRPHQTEILRHLLPVKSFDAQQRVIDHYLSRFPPFMLSDYLDEEALLKSFNQSIRLLSPLKQVPLGFDTLNQLISLRLRSKMGTQREEKMAIPIMITKNDYEQGLFNGETGVLIKHYPYFEPTKDDYALFPTKQVGEPSRKIPALCLRNFDYAYCLSIHKSQGSEFDHVMIVLPEGSERFGREAFYTAVTRAKKKIDIFGDDMIITNIINESSVRVTGISARLKELFK